MARQEQTAATLAAPPWAGDFRSRDHLVPGGVRVDAAQFRTRDAVKVDVGTAGASLGATSIPVEPLSGPIPAETTLTFDTATDKYATLSAAAATGATTLTVYSIPVALVDADVAWYEPNNDKPIPSGTAIGRTIAERDAGTNYGPAINTDDEIFLLAFDITDAAINPDGVLYRHGSVVKENYLPNWGDVTYWPTTLVTALRGLYNMVRGSD